LRQYSFNASQDYFGSVVSWNADGDGRAIADLIRL